VAVWVDVTDASVVLAWVDVAVTSVVVLEAVVVVGVKAWPPPQAQHMSNSVKSGSSQTPVVAHHEGADA
jgi:hypothetical protein